MNLLDLIDQLSAGGPGSGRHSSGKTPEVKVKWSKSTQNWNPDLIRPNHISIADIKVTQKFRSKNIVKDYVDKMRKGESIAPMWVSEIDKTGKYELTGPGGNHRLAALKQLGHTNQVVPVMEERSGSSWDNHSPVNQDKG